MIRKQWKGNSIARRSGSQETPTDVAYTCDISPPSNPDQGLWYICPADWKVNGMESNNQPDSGTPAGRFRQELIAAHTYQTEETENNLPYIKDTTNVISLY